MYSASLDINPITHPERLSTRLLVPRIRNRERTAADQMGREAIVGVRVVVCVTAPVSVSSLGAESWHLGESRYERWGGGGW